MKKNITKSKVSPTHCYFSSKDAAMVQKAMKGRKKQILHPKTEFKEQNKMDPRCFPSLGITH